MKNLIKIFLLFLIPVMGIFILSYPGVWKYRVESILNRKILKDSGWNLSIGKLSGHLFNEINSENIKIIHENGTSIFIPELQAQFNVAKSLTGNIHLIKLYIYDFQYYQHDKNNTENKVFILPDLRYNKFPLTIDNLNFNGLLEVTLPDTNHLIDLNIASELLPDEKGLNFNIDSFSMRHHAIDILFALQNTKVNINDRIVSVDPLNGNIADILLNGQLNFVQSNNQQLLKGNLNINNVVVPEYLFEDTPLQLKFSEINSNIRFDTDFKNYSGLVTVNNDLGLNMTGDFNISKINNKWLVQQIILQSEEAKLFVHGDFTDNKEINANFDLRQLDLSKWITQHQATDISGLANLNMVIDNGYIHSVGLDLKTHESAIFDNDTISVNGAFVYENNQLDIANPLTVSIGQSSITSTGIINFDEETIDMKIALQDMDVFLINNFWNDSLDNGTISGIINASGKINDPIVEGELIGKDIKYRNFYLTEMKISGKREHVDSLLGFTQLRLGNGNWNNIEFERGTIDALFNTNEIQFTNFDIVNGNEYLNGIGTLRGNRLYIDNIKSFYDNHYVVNTVPFNVLYENKKFSISPFILQLDDGVIEGEVNYDNMLQGNITFSNIDGGLLHPLIKNERYKFTGLMFGDIDFDNYSQEQKYSINLYIKNGAFAKEPFNHLKANMFYDDNMLTIEELVVQENENSNVKIIGRLPFNEARKTKKIELKSEFLNTNFEAIAQFLPEWYEMVGVVTGELNINGTGHQMVSDFNCTIHNAAFDKIALGTVKSRGGYDGKNLNFQTFSSDLGENHYTGFGYLPVDLNVFSETFGDFRDKDPLYIFTEGQGSNIDFITNYFDEVDNASGDYTLALELSGTWDNIIRNGRINANNVTLLTPLLEDPIEGLHGLVNINNNKLIIENLQGKMYRTGRRAVRKKDNITISGDMDMTSFFDPYINVKARGQEAFFRSLIYEIEGITDFNVNVAGRDTILISGEISPIDVELFQQLTTSELGVLPSEEGSTIIHYKIDFPIKGKVTLTNDQLDAVLIGDMSINQFGDREMDFSGELIIEEGKFYYYRDMFTITEGYMTFDNRGFNPYLDISANTIIDGERIDISIIGKIDNPTLNFTSESGFSQSDILELLTWRKKFESKDISSVELGTQATDMVFAWFGNQLDKNILELSGLNRLGLLENVDVRGTTGLITAEENFSISAPISDNVAINYAYRRSFGIIDSYHALGVELRLNRNLSLVGNIDRSGYMHFKYRLRYAY